MVVPCWSRVPNCVGLEVLPESSEMHPESLSSLHDNWALPGGPVVLLDLLGRRGFIEDKLKRCFP